MPRECLRSGSSPNGRLPTQTAAHYVCREGRPRGAVAWSLMCSCSTAMSCDGIPPGRVRLQARCLRARRRMTGSIDTARPPVLADPDREQTVGVLVAYLGPTRPPTGEHPGQRPWVVRVAGSGFEALQLSREALQPNRRTGHDVRFPRRHLRFSAYSPCSAHERTGVQPERERTLRGQDLALSGHGRLDVVPAVEFVESEGERVDRLVLDQEIPAAAQWSIVRTRPMAALLGETISLISGIRDASTITPSTSTSTTATSGSRRSDHLQLPLNLASSR
jgi:hypothetical protein